MSGLGAFLNLGIINLKNNHEQCNRGQTMIEKMSRLHVSSRTKMYAVTCCTSKFLGVTALAVHVRGNSTATHPRNVTHAAPEQLHAAVFVLTLSTRIYAATHGAHLKHKRSLHCFWIILLGDLVSRSPNLDSLLCCCSSVGLWQSWLFCSFSCSTFGQVLLMSLSLQVDLNNSTICSCKLCVDIHGCRLIVIINN